MLKKMAQHIGVDIFSLYYWCQIKKIRSKFTAILYVCSKDHLGKS